MYFVFCLENMKINCETIFEIQYRQNRADFVTVIGVIANYELASTKEPV